METPKTTPVEPADQPVTRQRPRGKRFLAVAATFLVWGLGHWLAGRRGRAVAWFVTWVVLAAMALTCLSVPRLLPCLFVVLPLEFIAFVVVLIDAFRCAGRSDRPMLRLAAARYVVGAAFLVIAIFFHPVAFLALYVGTHWSEAFVYPPRVASMAPTLQSNDRFLVHKRTLPIKRWDIVAFEPPDVPRVKWVSRIVGLPGEKVEVTGGKVRINDVPFDGPPGAAPYEGRLRFVADGNGVEGSPIVLGDGEYFVLGDNSPVAGDSRYWRVAAAGHARGALPAENIVGRVSAIYWPPSRWRLFDSR